MFSSKRADPASRLNAAGSNLVGEREKKFVPVVMRTPVEPLEGMETPEERLIKERNLKGVQP